MLRDPLSELAMAYATRARTLRRTAGATPDAEAAEVLHEEAARLEACAARQLELSLTRLPVSSSSVRRRIDHAALAGTHLG